MYQLYVRQHTFITLFTTFCRSSLYICLAFSWYGPGCAAYVCAQIEKEKKSYKSMVCKPCAKHGEPNSSSGSILALSSNFRLDRILDETQINFGDHKKTTDGWDREANQGYVPSEVTWAEVIRAGKGIRRHSPCDKHDRIHLSPISTKKKSRGTKFYHHH